MSALSQDAKLLAGSVWGLPIGRKTELTYKRPHAIWPRTRAALTELVEAGFISEVTDREGVHFKPTLRPSRLCSQFARIVRKAEGGGADGLILSPMPDDPAGAARMEAAHGG